MLIVYSVVVPLKNEEQNIELLVKEIEPIMRQLNQPWELLCIDDGSTDRTPQILKKLARDKPYMRVLTFAKNSGQSSAFDAGFKAALGEFIISMDGDLQNDPKDIPKLIALTDRADLVCGWRKDRKDSWSKRWISRLANAIRSRFCKDGMHDTGCSLKIYRRSCLKQIKLFQGMHRFLPALFLIEGFRIAEVPVNHRPRHSGKTNYHFFNRSFNTLADLLAVRWMHQRRLSYELVVKDPDE